MPDARPGSSQFRDRAKGDPDPAPGANVSYAYYCRQCQCGLFRVAWYLAPVGHDGSPREPGWAIECSQCGRVTLMPEAPDLSELRSVPGA